MYNGNCVGPLNNLTFQSNQTVLLSANMGHFVEPLFVHLNEGMLKDSPIQLLCKPVHRLSYTFWSIFTFSKQILIFQTDFIYISVTMISQLA